MSSMFGGFGGEGGGGGAAALQEYFCYQCERTVSISPSPEPVCPNCHGGFLEESETVPTNPNNPGNFNPSNAPSSNPFFGEGFPPSAAAFGGSGGGLPIVFSSSGGFGGGPGDIDLSTIFGGPAMPPASPFWGQPRTPNEFNPFLFLNDYFNTLRAGGANIQLVFENPGGGGAGEFRLPTNLGDYFIGPGLEQLIQQLAENDPNRYGTPPAAKSAIEGLPVIKITEELLASDSSQCAVCKDSFELSEEVKQMPCKHIYHKDCIMPWLEMHNSCPVCRYELPTDDPDYENRRTGQQQSANRTSSASNANIGGDNFGLGDQENATNAGNNQQMPRTVERRFRVSLPPWLLRFGSPAETSNSGRAAGGGIVNDGGGNDNNGNNNNGGRGQSNSGSGGGVGGQARQEDLD